MKTITCGKRLWSLLIAVLLLIALSGCGGASQTPAQTQPTQTQPTEAVGQENEQSSQPEAPAEPEQADSAAAEDLVVRYYDGDTNAPTMTTITFHMADGTIEVSALVKSMYTAEYTAPFSVQDGVLVIEDVENVDANMTDEAASSFFATIFPKSMTGLVWHIIEGDHVTILFGDPNGTDDPAVIADVTLTEEEAAVLGLNG